MTTVPTPPQTTTTGVDLLDLDAFVAGDEHALFDRLRADDPVSWQAIPGGDDGFWSLVRHADVVAVNRDWETFGIHDGTMIGERGGFLGIPPDALSLAADPPVHTRLRLVVNREFTRRAIEGLEPYVRAQIRSTLDELAARGAGGAAVDFVTTVADPLPVGVMGRLLGIPEDDRARLGAWTSVLDGSSRDGDAPADGALLGEAGVAIFSYANELAAARAGDPQDDLISRLLAAEVDGRHLDPFELALFFLLLLTAGTETTRAASSLGTLALLQHPDAVVALRDDPSLVPVAVEELLRFVSPIAYFRRTARRDVRVGGRELREGDQVVLWFAAANRDPAVFADPHRLDVRRDPNPHVAFGGGGPHFCLGAHLARLELRVLLEELLPRFPHLSVAGDVVRKRTNFMPGLVALPVATGADRGAGR